jgi:hypothetical protein
MAASDSTIQGYVDGVFWERNAKNSSRGGAAAQRKKR